MTEEQSRKHPPRVLPLFILGFIAVVIGCEYWFGTWLQLPTVRNHKDTVNEHGVNVTLELLVLKHSNTKNDKRLGGLEKEVSNLRETVEKTTERIGTHEHTQLVDSLLQLSNKVTALEEQTKVNAVAHQKAQVVDKNEWMNGLTKSLVVMQLAESKIHHYETFVKPSWDRLEFDPETAQVLPDLFIACHPNTCGTLDKKCKEIGRDVTADVFEKRQEHELLCFYAAVPEKEDESYRFAHSLNFLQMEPFNSILNLNYHEYILRSDADAIFFPGLLEVRPTGDGWIGSGYFGTELTPHLVRRYQKRFMPSLGPLRPRETTPSMQSTFYVHKSKFRQFVSVLLHATKTFHKKAFTRKVCNEIKDLTIAHELHPGERHFCRWAYWHWGVASLYGTRVAVDHVLENVSVTKSLDAMSSAMDQQDISTTIQAHLLELKHVLVETLWRNLTGLCLHPMETMRQHEKERGGGKNLFKYMETVYRDPEMADRDTAHYVANILFRHFHKLACLENEAEAGIASSDKDVASNDSKREAEDGSGANDKDVVASNDSKQEAEADSGSNEKDVASNDSKKKAEAGIASSDKDVASNDSKQEAENGSGANDKDVVASNDSKQEAEADSGSNEKDVASNDSKKKAEAGIASSDKDVASNDSKQEAEDGSGANDKDVVASNDSKQEAAADSVLNEEDIASNDSKQDAEAGSESNDKDFPSNDSKREAEDGSGSNENGAAASNDSKSKRQS